jgi:hypothetical protein
MLLLSAGGFYWLGRDVWWMVADTALIVRHGQALAWGGGIGVILLLWHWGWLAPAVTVELAPGQSRRLSKQMHASGRDREQLPMTFVETAWGRRWGGGRAALKAEFRTEQQATELKAGDLRKPTACTHIEVIVSAGPGLRPGSYLCRAWRGAVRVRVRG